MFTMEENIRKRINVDYDEIIDNKAEEHLDNFFMRCIDTGVKATLAPDEIIEDFTLMIADKVGGRMTNIYLFNL